MRGVHRKCACVCELVLVSSRVRCACLCLVITPAFLKRFYAACSIHARRHRTGLLQFPSQHQPSLGLGHLHSRWWQVLGLPPTSCFAALEACRLANFPLALNNAVLSSGSCRGFTTLGSKSAQSSTRTLGRDLKSAACACFAPFSCTVLRAVGRLAAG